ncbi:MAG: AAA family ATPase [Pseudomonadota bacterium]
MYTQFFNLKQSPFSIAPDPRYLFMSERHREALAHLLYGVGSGGGFVLLTGEIGAGKTTVCRCFMEQIPENCRLAYIFNPKLSVEELLLSICDEFGIVLGSISGAASVKTYVDAINGYLLASHAEGKNNVLVIDEAQKLSARVLEQLRLLTNLETSERKLLQIILIGQPELRQLLARPELEQLAQRVIARYHLGSLSQEETGNYIRHRLAVSGAVAATPFGRGLFPQIHQLSKGIPRRINLLCDRAMLGAYVENQREVTRKILEKAAVEVFATAAPGNSKSNRRSPKLPYVLGGVLAGAALTGAAVWYGMSGTPAPVTAATMPTQLTQARNGAAAPGAAAPGAAAPGAAAPGAVVPGAVVPGAAAPGAATPASSTAALPHGAASATGAAHAAVAAQAPNAAPAPSAKPAPAASHPATVAAAVPAPVQVPAQVSAPMAAAVQHAAPVAAAPASAAATAVPAADPLRAEGLRELAALWGVALPAGDPCAQAAKLNLRCHQGGGGLDELRALDRPAMLTLYGEQSARSYVLLTGLHGAIATVRMGEKELDIGVPALASRFRGEFVTLWRAPPDWRAQVAAADRGPEVDWLAKRLAQMHGLAKPADGQPLDPKMQKLLREFQAEQKIPAEGMAGPQTFIHLVKLGGSKEPHLSGRAPASRTVAGK